jgi:hypothetical protein
MNTNRNGSEADMDEHKIHSLSQMDTDKHGSDSQKIVLNEQEFGNTTIREELDPCLSVSIRGSTLNFYDSSQCE